MIVEYEEAELIPEETKRLNTIFLQAFNDVEGGSLSQQERNVRNLLGTEYTYGEVEFLHFLPLLNFVSAEKKHGVFWDLGCGTGKALVAAALCDAGFTRICGVEFLEGLCRTSLRAIDSFCKISEKAGLKTSRSVFKVVEGDMKTADWLDADVVYTSSICFPEDLIKALAEKGRLLKKGARVITLRNWADTSNYKILYYFKVKMTWGSNSVYVLERI